MTLKKRIFLDASAWITLFEDFPAAQKVELALRTSNERFTSLINFYEVLLWYQHRKPQLKDWAAGQIKAYACLMSLDESVVQQALFLKQRHPDFSMADALSFSTANNLQADFVTLDPDFEKVKGAVFLRQ